MCFFAFSFLFKCHPDIIKKLTFSVKKIFQKYHQCIRQFWPRSGPTLCRVLIWVQTVYKKLSAELTLYLLVLSADNLCKQFKPRSGLIECQTWSGSRLFDNLIISLKIKRFLKKIIRWQKVGTESRKLTINPYHVRFFFLYKISPIFL